MTKWKCPACSHLNSSNLRSCIKRCGTRRPELAVADRCPSRLSMLQRDRLASGRAQKVEERSPLYRAILAAKAASKVLVVA